MTAQAAAAPAATTIGIRALESRVAPGGTTTVAGLLEVTGLSAQGRTVDLEARPTGAEAFAPIGTAVADQRGRLRLEIQPAVTTSYRWHYAGDVDAHPRLSGVVSVRVRTPNDAGDRRPTTLSVAAVRGVVAAGKKDVVRGQLRWGQQRLGKRHVVLLARPAGQQAWRFRTSHRTGHRPGQKGKVSFAVRPSVSTEYRLAFAGTSGFRPATSAIVTVDVRPTLSVTALPAQIAPGGSSAISGIIIHADSPVAGAMVELLARPVVPGSVWVVEATGSSAVDGTIGFSVRPDRDTRYRLRAQPVGGLPTALSRVLEVRVDS